MNEQIAMIDRVLNELQENVAHRAVQFFVYGWVILAGCISHFVLIYLDKPEWIQANWMVVPIASIILGLVTGSRNSNLSNVSISELLLKNVWGVVGMVMVYLCLIAPQMGFIPHGIVLPLALILMFTLVLITGITIKHSWTIVLSSLWFFGSVAASMSSPEYHVHILMLVVLFGNLLPSYLIRVKFK